MTDFILNTTADQWGAMYLIVCAIYGAVRSTWDLSSLMMWAVNQLASMGPKR